MQSASKLFGNLSCGASQRPTRGAADAPKVVLEFSDPAAQPAGAGESSGAATGVKGIIISGGGAIGCDCCGPTAIANGVIAMHVSLTDCHHGRPRAS